LNFFSFPGTSHDPAIVRFGELSDDRTHRAGRCRNEHRAAGREVRNPLESYPRGHTRHTEYAQIRLDRRQSGVELLHAIAIGLPVLPPTQASENVVTFGKTFVPRLDDFTDTASFERFSNLKR